MRKSPTNQTYSCLFVTLCFLFLFLPLTGLGLSWRGVYDRYLLALLPFALFLSVGAIRNIGAVRLQHKTALIAFTLLLLYGGFAVAGTHDYLSANRVIWRGLNDLMERDHISPHRIRGGFEFYGWYLCKERNRTSKQKEIAFACLWTNDQADYVLSFEPINEYQEVRRYSFRTWMPPARSELFLLRIIRDLP
jgi:hypothetical protein